MADECADDHIDFTGSECPECRLAVDRYGNTEACFRYCSFPDCGCDGARVCAAQEPSIAATNENVEGMWSGKAKHHVKARMKMLGKYGAGGTE